MIRQDIRDQCGWDFYHSSCGHCEYGLNNNCQHYTEQGCPNGD